MVRAAYGRYMGEVRLVSDLSAKSWIVNCSLIKPLVSELLLYSRSRSKRSKNVCAQHNISIIY